MESARRQRRLRRARRRHVGLAVGATAAVLAAAAGIFGVTVDDGGEAAAGTAATRLSPSTHRRVTATTTTTTLPPRPAVNPDFPPAPPSSGTGRRIVYCNSCQRVWLMDDDTYAFASYPVSGRRGTPRPGAYHVFRKINPGGAHGLRLPYFIGFAYGTHTDIGFHGIPLRRDGSQIQSNAELGQFRSAGCVREHQWTARLLWDWTPMGTTVVVVA